MPVPTPGFFACNSLILVRGATDDFLWNMRTVKHCALTFFVDSCKFSAFAGFCHDPSVRPAKDQWLGVTFVLLLQMRGFIKYYRGSYLLVCTTLEPVISYVAQGQ